MRVAAVIVAVVPLLVAGCGTDDEPQAPTPSGGIAVTSGTFAEGRTIPVENTCRGSGTAPDLAWTGVPADATSLALVVDDPDAPGGTFVHWVVYDLQPEDGGLTGDMPAGAKQAENSGGSEGWQPPCPPSGTHHYRFTVHALNQKVSGGSRDEILSAIESATVAQGTLTGLVSAG